MKQLTGADLVTLRSWMVRTSGDLDKRQRKLVGYIHPGGLQPSAFDSHVDCMPEQAEAKAAIIYKESFPDARARENIGFRTIAYFL